MKYTRIRFLTGLGLLAVCTSSTLAPPLETAITFQGQVKLEGIPLNANADFRFSLWNTPTGGVTVPGTQTILDVAVVNGLFTVSIDFGPGAFDGSAKWLAVEIRHPAGSGQFIPMSPRHPINAAPYALYALNSPGGGSGGTLDQAYDSGGPGAGRTINADAGEVHIAGPDGLRVENGVHSGPVSVGDPDADLDVRSHHSFGPDGAQPDPSTVGVSIRTGNIISSQEKWTYLRVADVGNAIRRNTGSNLYFDVEGAINSLGLWVSQMVLDANGNLGIGWPTPETRLQVHGGTDVSPSGGGFVTIGRTDQNNIGMDTNEIMARNNGAPAALFINNDGGNVNFSAAGAGNVGVGTSNPKGKLHVAGDYYGLGHMWLHAYEGDGNSGTAYIQARDTSSTSNIDLQFRTKQGANYRDAMRLESNGDVTIPGALDIGYEIVSSSANDVYSHSVSCPAGKRVLGGGCVVGLNNTIITSEANGLTGWYCAVADNSGPVRTEAICARVK